MHIKNEAFEAWRRVIEITLASCPADILPKDTRQTVIAEVLQDLLSKVRCKGYLDFFCIKQFVVILGMAVWKGTEKSLKTFPTKRL